MVQLEPGVTLVVGEDAPRPIELAVEDLRRDLERVLGERSTVVTDIGELSGRPGILVESAGAELTGTNELTGQEAHRISVEEIAGRDHVVLRGADVRGTIYAIYSFSERFLDVPPLWFWASWEPERRDSIDVPAETDIHLGPPEVEYRAWFPNDLDFMQMWRHRSQENFEAFVETMLRLKLNTLEGGIMNVEGPIIGPDPYEEPYRSGPTTRLARDRGLVNTTHHVRPFGAKLKHWDNYWRNVRDREPPELSLSDKAEFKQLLGEFWRYHIETALRDDLEMLWTLGFRGTGDEPFWVSVDEAPDTPAQRAALIEEMVEYQIELLRDVRRPPSGRSCAPRSGGARRRVPVVPVPR